MVTMDVTSALLQHGEAGAAIVDLLYGDGADEVSKAISEKTQNRIATASNVVGIGAGLAALPGATRDFRNAARAVRPPKAVKAKGTFRPLARIGGTKAGQAVAGAGRKLATPKAALALAGGGLALQAGNVGGDFVTNRVLARTNKQAEVKKAAEHEIEWSGEISKSDDDKRQVFGWASVTAVNGVPVADLQGDEIDLEEIEKAAYTYVQASRKGGNMHLRTDDDQPHHVSDLIESLVVTPDKAKELGMNGGKEGWWVGFQVHDEQTWQDYKDGKLTQFSIHGKGKRA